MGGQQNHSRAQIGVRTTASGMGWASLHLCQQDAGPMTPGAWLHILGLKLTVELMHWPLDGKALPLTLLNIKKQTSKQ